jgi:hypothetical protein
MHIECLKRKYGAGIVDAVVRAHPDNAGSAQAAA